jgi:hypothetical protein
MDPKTFHKFELPFQLEELSKTDGGIYFFSFRFPTDYELGIATGRDATEVLKNVASRLDKYARAYSNCELAGSLNDGKADHMRMRFDIDGKLVACTNPSKILDSILDQTGPGISPEEITRVIRFAFKAEKPIYIGICYDQPFYDRISQHMNGQTGLVPFLKDCQLTIMDVAVHCLAMDVPDRIRLRRYEQLVQSIFRPAFSLT